jgi:hypothetical protein
VLFSFLLEYPINGNLIIIGRISFVIDCVNGNDKNMENMDMKTRKYIMYLHFGLKMIDRYIGFRMLSGIYFVVEAIMLATNDLGHKMTIYK